jgi:excisionase family DNA binding protein
LVAHNGSSILFTKANGDVGESIVIQQKQQTSVMTLQQAASYLQISKAHLSNVINGKVAGVTPVRCFRMGRRILIKREWIEEWLEVADRESLSQC